MVTVINSGAAISRLRNEVEWKYLQLLWTLRPDEIPFYDVTANRQNLNILGFLIGVAVATVSKINWNTMGATNCVESHQAVNFAVPIELARRNKIAKKSIPSKTWTLCLRIFLVTLGYQQKRA